MNKSINGCSTCAKFKEATNQCIVLREPIENCWAWTDDPDWEKKVKKQVEEYRKGKIK